MTEHSRYVSVLLPVYNAKPYLSMAIDSILNQTFSDFELIIIDDGSSDGCALELQKYAQSDKRIRFISRENKGISITRNELVELATGKYIAWMDSDDISLPNRLEIMTLWMEEHQDFVAAGCRTILIDADGDEICLWDTPLDHHGIDSWHISNKGGGGAIIFPSSIMLKDAVIKIGQFNENLVGAEDLDLFLKLAEIGKIANIDNILYKYRQHVKNISYSRKQVIKLDTISVIKAACLRRGLPLLDYPILDSKGDSIVEIHLRWAWWAIKARNLKTARKYAILSVLDSPFKVKSWKVLVCAIRGY